jgi:hypothetical protein
VECDHVHDVASDPAVLCVLVAGLPEPEGGVKERQHVDVRVGQVWRSSDPRRLTAFRIIRIEDWAVFVEAVYPSVQDGGWKAWPMTTGAFRRLGQKGYMRV